MMNESKRKSTGTAKNYAVGYRKPPKSSRFKKGRSGNPGGRPKGSSTSDPFKLRNQSRFTEMALEQLSETVVVKTGEGSEELRIDEAVFRLQKSAALNGSQSAQRFIIKQGELVERKIEQECSLKQKEVEGLIAKQHTECKRAQEALGTTYPVVPHPNDICFNPDTGGFAILGPMNSGMRKALEREFSVIIEILRELSELETKLERAGDQSDAEELEEQIDDLEQGVRFLLKQAREKDVQLWLIRFVDEEFSKIEVVKPEYWDFIETVLFNDAFQV